MKIEIKGGSKPEYLHIFSKFKDSRDIKYFMHRARPSRRLRHLLKGRKYLYRFYEHEFNMYLSSFKTYYPKLSSMYYNRKGGCSLRYFINYRTNIMEG